MSDQVAEMSATYLFEAAQDAVPVGYKQTEVGVIPNGWSMLSLSQLVATLESGVSVNSVDRAEAFPHGMHILKTSCVNGGYFYESEVKSILPRDIKRAKCPAVKGSIIISRMNTPALVGELGYVPRDYPYSFLPDRLWQMRLNKKSETDSRWLAYLLSYPQISRKIKESATGTSGSMKNISKGSFLSLQIPYPEPEEQTAIANALSDVDALISDLEKLIAKKQAIKTATMQQLLTGRTRLPEFALHEDGTPKGYKKSELGEIPEDWDIEEIGDNCRTYSGGTPSTSNKNFYGGDIRWITSSDLNKGIIHEVQGRITEEGLRISSAKLVVSRTFLIALYGATAGVCAITMVESAINQAVLAVVPISHTPKYLHYWFSKNKNEIIETYTQGGQPNLSGDIIRSIKLPMPSKEEQTAIATILSEMDEEIQSLEHRLGKTRQIKQGMMQELLTGKTRLVAPAG